MEHSMDFLGGCIVLAAFILSSAIKAAIKIAVETPKNCKVDWNPTVTIAEPQKKREPQPHAPGCHIFWGTNCGDMVRCTCGAEVEK